MTRDDRPSKTQLKRQADELQALGERLLGLPEARLAQLPLPDPLLDAVRHGRELSQRGALRRQRQYIGKLMRELDTTDLEAAVIAMDRHESDANARFHAIEQWRDRVLDEGMVALEELFDTYPGADRQRLRQLMLAARNEADKGKPPRHRRELFQALRHLVENGPGVND